MLTVSRLEHGQPHLRALADCAFPLTGNLPSTVCAAASTPRAWSLSSRRGAEEMAVLYVDGLDAGVFCCDAWVPDVDAAVKQPQPRNAGNMLTFWVTTRTTETTLEALSGAWKRCFHCVLFPRSRVRASARIYGPYRRCGGNKGLFFLVTLFGRCASSAALTSFPFVLFETWMARTA